MINLYDTANDALIGSISEHDLQYLIDSMEEEFPEDTDYSITPMELAYFEQHNAPAELIGLLRKALDGREELIIRWTRSA